MSQNRPDSRTSGGGPEGWDSRLYWIRPSFRPIYPSALHRSNSKSFLSGGCRASKLQLRCLSTSSVHTRGCMQVSWENEPKLPGQTPGVDDSRDSIKPYVLSSSCTSSTQMNSSSSAERKKLAAKLGKRLGEAKWIRGISPTRKQRL
jgi:hypothetical protein